MSAKNITVQQYSPLIRYTPDGKWKPGTQANDVKYYSDYYDGYMTTNSAGAAATFTFTGTGVWVYGSRRSNHGKYTVQLDGDSLEETFDGRTPSGFRQVLFGANGLDNKPHTVVLSNAPLSHNLNYVDIDYIVYEMQLDPEFADNEQRIAMSSATYDSAWSMEEIASQQSLLISDAPNSAIKLSFVGDNVEIWGSVSKASSKMQVTIDGLVKDIVDLYREEERTSALLWSANSLGSSNHTLELMNVQATDGNTDGRTKVSLDYALIRGLVAQPNDRTTINNIAPVSLNPSLERAFTSDTGVIIGSVLGSITLFLLLGSLIFYWEWRKQPTTQPPAAHISAFSASLPLLASQPKPRSQSELRIQPHPQLHRSKQLITPDMRTTGMHPSLTHVDQPSGGPEAQQGAIFRSVNPIQGVNAQGGARLVAGYWPGASQLERGHYNA